MRLLLDHGADAGLKNRSGATALDKAKRSWREVWSPIWLNAPNTLRFFSIVIPVDEVGVLIGAVDVQAHIDAVLIGLVLEEQHRIAVPALVLKHYLGIDGALAVR
ncbi:MAG: hypothetical protein HY549_13360 [Elusimicrobia bacterium]|nr:hypothetical protein [Elusimicrobiota bacterium]